MHWYDTSLKYLKRSIELVNEHFSEELNEGVNYIKSILLKMKIYFTTYHNTMLIERKRFIGEEWKLYPYIVDEDTLQMASVNSSRLKTFNVKRDHIVQGLVES
jgi:hypothetical protein